MRLLLLVLLLACILLVLIWSYEAWRIRTDPLAPVPGTLRQAYPEEFVWILQQPPRSVADNLLALEARTQEVHGLWRIRGRAERETWSVIQPGFDRNNRRP